MGKTMTKEDVGKAMQKFASAYPDHTVALIAAPQAKINAIAQTLNVDRTAPGLKSQKVAYLVVPAWEGGSLPDTAVERVVGGLGDKYEANCDSLLALGTSSMVVINIA